LILTVEHNRGVLTVLWHNTYMQGEYLEFYKKLLQYCSEKDAWMAPGAQICDWWNKEYNL
jgi:hypothetical protein